MAKDSNGMNKAQKKFIVGAALLVFAIVYLIFTGVKASGTYYYTVSEVATMSPGQRTSGLRLEGRVAPGTIIKDSANLKLTFDITDESNASITVEYKGVTPDMFQEEIDVVVEGAVSKEGRFIANKLLTSCPSKYEAADKVKDSG